MSYSSLHIRHAFASSDDKMGNLCPLAIHQDILEALHRPDLLLGQEQVQSLGEHLEEDRLDILPAVVTGRLPEG